MIMMECSQNRIIKSAEISPTSSMEIGSIQEEACSYRNNGLSFKATCGSLIVMENQSKKEPRKTSIPWMVIHAKAKKAEPPITLRGLANRQDMFDAYFQFSMPVR